MTDEPSQIFLSPPDVGPRERDLLLDAFDSNWIAPMGPHVEAFEQEIAAFAGAAHAVALSSGSAGLHLALIAHGVGPGDEVVVPTLTFAATAFAVMYQNAVPVFIDADADSWNLDPALLEELLTQRAASNALPKAVLTVDLYGRCADYDAIEAICGRYEVPVIEDAAEALGATLNGRGAGSFGRCGVFSFNGNKIITTSGGGMLVTDDADLAATVRHLATQAREPVPHYEHAMVGYNYRLSNLLAALGRGQLEGLPAKIDHRKAVRDRYAEALDELDGWRVRPASDGDNAWLTTVELDVEETGYRPIDVCTSLAAQRIEARPAWKPMHLQPVFAAHESIGGSVAARAFAVGLCLPSGSSLTIEDQDRVVEAVRHFDATAHR